MAASHHHQQSHHMNNIHGSSATTTNTTCVMSEEEGEDDLAALRIAALKTLEQRKLKKEPRALIVQRNNVLVIEPQDDVRDFRHSPPARRFSRERSLSPIGHRRGSREASPAGRKISSPSCRWSPRSNNHRRSPSPYHLNGGHHSPAHHSWNSSKRRSSPRAHSPRRLSNSPRRRSPVRRRSPPRRSPHRLALSPGRRSPRKSPPRSPGRRSSPQRSPLTRRSPRKSPVRGSPRRFSPRRRLRDSSASRSNKSTRRNVDKRRASPPAQSSSSSSSVSNRRKTTSPKSREPTERSPDPREATEVVAPSAKKGRFERFEDSAASDDDSCNESLLDELFRETEETSARTEALESESLDENSQANSCVIDTPIVADENKVEDGDCLLLQDDDDMDDLLVECNASESVAVSIDQPFENSGSTDTKRGEQEKIFKERDLDEKNRGRGRHNDHRSESHVETVSRSRHSRSERTSRIEKKENRERRSKVPKDDHKNENNTEKRKRSRSHDKDRSKRKPSRKTSDKEERHTSEPKLETRTQSHISKSRTHASPEKDISVEDRERLEARKKKFLQKELKPLPKVISLKKSPSRRTEETDDVRRVQDRLGEPVKESKRSSPRGDDTVETSSKPTILSRLGPPPASRTSIKDRIGHMNTNSSSPTQTSLTGTDAAQVKFEVRNRPTLDPKLKIHINLGGPLSTGSSGGSSKSKKVVCLE